jgi:hypothetical protein
MSRTDYGWAWFESFADPGLDDAAHRPGDPALAIAFARCFASDDGARVLAHLRALTLERAIGPGASDTALRHLEGQRALVLHIQSMAARGANAFAARSPAAAPSPATLAADL